MHDCASILILRELLVRIIFHIVHPYVTIHSVEWFLHLFLCIIYPLLL